MKFATLILFFSFCIPQQSLFSASPPIAARLNGEEITEEELDAFIGKDAFNLKQGLYRLRMNALTSIVQSRLLEKEAARAGLPVVEFLNREIGPAPVPKPLAVERSWMQNRDSLRALGETAARYRLWLDEANRGRVQQVRNYLDRLQAKAQLAVLLTPPATTLQAGSSCCRLGPEDGAIDVTLFFDYECSHCAKADALLEAVRHNEPIGGSIIAHYKHYPLPLHKTAFDSAVSAVCAARQGSFAEFHKALFATEDHSGESLRRLASESGLEPKAFSACLLSDEAALDVLADMEDARRSGVDATPAMFLNGRPVPVPQSIEDWRKLLLNPNASSEAR